MKRIYRSYPNIRCVREFPESIISTTLKNAKSESFILSNDIIENLADMKNQKNKQTQLIPKYAKENHFILNGEIVLVTENGITTRNNF